MKKNFVHVIILLTILITLCVLTGCKSDNEENLLNDKIESELLYLDSKILSMANTLNNISFQNNKITTKSVEIQEGKVVQVEKVELPILVHQLVKDKELEEKRIV